MLPKSHHVETVYSSGDNSILSANISAAEGQAKKMFIECSTIDPAVSREVGAKIQASGSEYADAAVSVRLASSPNHKLQTN